MKARVLMAGLTALTVAMLVGAPVARAGNNDPVERGACSGSSDWELKVSPENGRLEVEFEVDQNRNGVRWTVVLVQNGKQLRRVTRVTKAPSGSFEVRVVAPNTSGTDTFAARATSPSSEVCSARASF